jgi:hypothetical protein
MVMTDTPDRIPVGNVLRPTPLGRFVVWLEDAGYSRCLDEDRNLLGKEYRIRREDRVSSKATGAVILEGRQGACELYFNECGELVGHDVLEWA